MTRDQPPLIWACMYLHSLFSLSNQQVYCHPLPSSVATVANCYHIQSHLLLEYKTIHYYISDNSWLHLASRKTSVSVPTLSPAPCSISYLCTLIPRMNDFSQFAVSFSTTWQRIPCKGIGVCVWMGTDRKPITSNLI